MENLQKELERLERKANLSASIGEVDNIIDQLKAARAAVEADPTCTQKTLLTTQSPVKKSFDKINDNLKDVYNGLNKYGKAMKEKFKERPLPFAEEDTLEAVSSQPSLINRAIAMHLLREGMFDVASTFINEANANMPSAASTTDSNADDRLAAADTMDSSADDAPSTTKEPWTSDFSPLSLKSTALQQHFSSMYQILDAMRSRNDLGPAISWARSNSALLEARGSNLEFDLCRLHYITLFNEQGPLAAVAYARRTFPSFPARYASQTRQLLGALAFAAGVQRSPYGSLFAVGDGARAATASAAAAFTAEFCALLSLSSASPLFTAVTAGCIALPTLAKFAAIARQVGTSWTTSVELPVEVPLPPGYVFHSIFVCPVSKEQATDRNPPMMMPCGHVVARESLEGMSAGRRFKCPYCPSESLPADALRLYL